MAALLADPFGRQLLSLLTADYGLPGDPGRRVLRQLQLRAQAASAPRSVTLAIRAALAALRAEFSGPLPIAPCPIASGPGALLGL